MVGGSVCIHTWVPDGASDSEFNGSVSQSGASDSKFNRPKSSMGQWVPKGASDSECNGSVGQSVFIRGFPVGLATVNSIGRVGGSVCIHTLVSLY